MMGFPHLDHQCHDEELRGLPYYDLANNEILELLLSCSHGEYWSSNHEPAFMNQLPQEHQLITLPPRNLSESSSFDDAYGCMAALATPAMLEPPWSSLDVNLPALQLLASGFYHHLHQKSMISGATAENRRCSSSWDQKPSQTPPLRNPRFEHRCSISPLKIRKEKLGDRIAALQQLVAPFGKTDTASVLMEAIDYIKFLLDKVENLTEKYMKLSGNKRSRTVMQEVADKLGEESFEPKAGLKSRGLCLVPLSCTSYIVSEETD